MRGLSNVFAVTVAAALFAGVDAQLVCNATNTECLGFASCDAVLSSDSYGAAGMSCKHLEDWHCCDCTNCECGDCSTCAGYKAAGLSCFEIQRDYGEDCHNCQCDCAAPNQQDCTADWSQWGACGGTLCGEVSSRNRTWVVELPSVNVGTTASGVRSCDINDGPPGGADGDIETEACTMPACVTTPMPLSTATELPQDIVEVCAAFDNVTFTANANDPDGFYTLGDSYTRGDLENFVTCEEMATVLEDGDGNLIDYYLLLQCGCICENMCSYDNGGTIVTQRCSTAYECQDPCDFESEFEPSTQIFTSGGSGPVSCNNFQTDSIAEFVAFAFPGLTGTDITDKEAQLLAEGQFGCEYQAASLDPNLADCRVQTAFVQGLTPACQCTEYNTTTPSATTQAATTLPDCGRNDTEKLACYALMADFPDLDNQCTFFLRNFDAEGNDGFGIDCRSCGCTTQCFDPTTPPTTTTFTTSTTETTTTTTSTTVTTTTTTTTTGTAVSTENACESEFIDGILCASLVGFIECDVLFASFNETCDCFCNSPTDPPTTTSTTTTVCEVCRLGLNCDEMQDLWISSDNHRYTCGELESAYECDCSNCLCAADSTTTSSTATDAPGCQVPCVGDIDCDELSQFYYDDLSTVVTCDDLTTDLGCDCTGCACSITPVDPPTGCMSTCGGFTCDDWDTYLGSDFSCDTMTNVYGCDCSDCECTSKHDECLITNNDFGTLCKIGEERRSCDEWQTDPLGGPTLTCQYLEFYFGCDCTNCQCAGEPECGVDGKGTV